MADKTGTFRIFRIHYKPTYGPEGGMHIGDGIVHRDVLTDKDLSDAISKLHDVLIDGKRIVSLEIHRTERVAVVAADTGVSRVSYRRGEHGQEEQVL